MRSSPALFSFFLRSDSRDINPPRKVKKKAEISLLFILTVFLSFNFPHTLQAAPSEVTRYQLPNGMRVIYLRQNAVDAFGLFAFIPLGLTQDEKDKTQWSHLLEHLILTSTGQIRDFRKVNGETGADYLRLDFMGSMKEADEGLKLMASWLSKTMFTEEALKLETLRANSEVGPSANRLFAHKWATAAWNQVVRHGAKSVSIKEPLQKATLKEIHSYRDRHLSHPQDIVIVCTSKDDPKAFKEKLQKALKSIPPSKKKTPNAKLQKPKTGKTEVEWDLPVSHFLKSFKAPPVDHPDFLAFLIAQQIGSTMGRFYTNFKQHTGMVFTQLEINPPQGRYLSISGTLKPGTKVADVNKECDKLISLMTQSLSPLQFHQIRQSVIQRLEKPYAIQDALRFKSATNTEMMIAGNRAIQWGIIEFRYGEHREKILKGLKKLTAAQVSKTLKKHLDPKKGHTLILKPKG